MVTDVRDEPAEVAYERFKKMAEDDPALTAERWRSGASLKEEGGRFASSTNLVSTHPEKRGMNLEAPYYCLTLWDATYEEEAFDVAEAIEDVVDVEVYVFHREK